MSLNVKVFTLGPLENNTYLLEDTASAECVVIDPTYEINELRDYIIARGLKLISIWITHAHFDHVIGVPLLWQETDPHPSICLHQEDLPLWKKDGGAREFNLHFSLPLQPDCFLFNLQKLSLGQYEIEVRHTPGHTPGHVVFYSSDLHTLFSGDVIFYHSIGRTDLPGGNHETLLSSISDKIFTLPDDTCIRSGHGSETSIAEEKRSNPFLK